MKCGFIMLNLKQKLSQSSGNELVPYLPRSFQLFPSAGKVMLVALLQAGFYSHVIECWPVMQAAQVRSGGGIGD